MNDPLKTEFNHTTPVIHQVLHHYRTELGADFIKYDHHVRRVYHLCCLIDPNPQHHLLYEIAAVYHDLGIWTAQTFDYLNPSIELACEYLKHQQLSELSKPIVQMIDQHHKISAYKGSDAQLVETFRQADWIDLSFGYIRFRYSREQFGTIFRQYPGKGFHRFLIRKTLQNFWQHPYNPLPMFKR